MARPYRNEKNAFFKPESLVSAKARAEAGYGLTPPRSGLGQLLLPNLVTPGQTGRLFPNTPTYKNLPQ